MEARQDVFNIRNDAVFKAATGLAAGSVMTCDGSCGAYSGASMILGRLVGREWDNLSDPEGVSFQTHRLARKCRARDNVGARSGA